MYKAIASYDPQGILQHEWLNSRGAIPKFEPQAIEIRIIDSQECVKADMAIADVVIALLKSWSKNNTYPEHAPCATMQLKQIYDDCIQDGTQTLITDSQILEHWQLPKRNLKARDAWSMLIEKVSSDLSHETQRTLQHILSQGNLSERILRVYQQSPQHDQIERIYRQMVECLSKNQLFEGI